MSSSQSSSSSTSNQDLLLFIKDGCQIIAQCVRASNTLPVKTAREMYKCHKGFIEVTDKLSNEVLKQANQVLEIQGEKGALKIHSDDMEKIMDANDNILERVNSNIDIIEKWRIFESAGPSNRY